MSVLTRTHSVQRIKPIKWPVRNNLARVAPEWRWAWEGEYFHMAMWEGGGDPFVYTDGRVFQPDYTVDGSPEWIPGERGRGLEFLVSEGDAYHLPHADLPDWFPMKASEPYTACSLVRCDATANTNTHNLVHKNDVSSDGRYLYYAEEESGQIRVKAWLEDTFSNQVVADSLLPLSTPVLVGTRWDGTTAHAIVDGVLEGAVNTTLATSTSSLNIATRTTSHDGTDRSFNGTWWVFYTWGRPLKESQLRQLARDPFAPFRMVRPMMVAAALETGLDNARLADMAFCRGRAQYGPGRLPVPDGTID